MGLDNAYGIGSLKPGICTSSTRPASPFEGQTIYETDTDRLLVYNNTSWVVTHDPQRLSFTASSLSNNLLAFNAERNVLAVVGQNYPMGNGSTSQHLSIPFSGKLVAATLTATSDINGNITIRPFLNTALVGVTTYDLTVNASTPIAIGDFLSNPLSIPSGQRFNYQVQAVTATVGLTVLTFYIRLD